MARFRAGAALGAARFRVPVAVVAVRFRALDEVVVLAAVEVAAVRLPVGIDETAGRWAERVALPIAALVVLRAARSAVRAADCAANSVD